MAYIVNNNDLPGNFTSRKFEGYLHNDANLSFFLSATPPGRGPALHTHPYEEIFVVRAGTLTFTVGDEIVEVSGEHIVVVPPGTPHKFINSGTETAHHIDIHANARMETTWLEEDA
jgi:mannose-6-phosphate isomerase-like protein (cupin superfamily)